MSRDVKRATPFMQWFIPELINQVWGVLGIKIFVIDIDRDYKVQVAYYAQGRQPVDEVNILRRHVGLPPITSVQNKKKITWTMASKHICNLDDSDPNNDLSRAVDIGVMDDNKRYRGEGDADVNKDGAHDYEQIGKIGERIGQGRIKWGGRFGDEPHFEQIP